MTPVSTYVIVLTELTFLLMYCAIGTIVEHTVSTNASQSRYQCVIIPIYNTISPFHSIARQFLWLVKTFELAFITSGNATTNVPILSNGASREKSIDWQCDAIECSHLCNGEHTYNNIIVELYRISNLRMKCNVFTKTFPFLLWTAYINNGFWKFTRFRSSKLYSHTQWYCIRLCKMTAWCDI